MSFTGKVNAGMKNIGTSVKNGMDNAKIEGQIAEEQKKIKILKREIADLVMVKLDACEEFSPEIMERYEGIVKAREQIEELKSSRQISYVVCEECGAKTSKNMQYCGKCGTKLEK